MSIDELREQALSLPAEERAKLAHDLLKSLDGSLDPDVEAAWMVEVERRAHDMSTGAVEGVEWGVARERIAQRLRDRRQ